MRRFLIFHALSVALWALALWFAMSDEAAMRACLERHNMDTCHYAMNR